MNIADVIWNGHHVERRKAQRFSISFPVHVVWYTNDKVVKVSGKTSDISINGLRFITDETVIPLRSNVRARVDFRAGLSDKLLTLVTAGVVIRHETLRNGRTALCIKNFRHELKGAHEAENEQVAP